LRTLRAERTRDAERTREAILVAAEDRFARLGFDGTSLQQIGDTAGVARSTPAYFFRSKEALYDAVLARAVARAQEAMARAYAEGDEDRSAEDAVESYVGGFLDFSRPRSELRPPHPARGARRWKPRRRVLRPLCRRGRRRAPAGS
jgi:AcrR family transcriptional regulator